MIYLDNNATTPVDSRVRDAMQPFLEDLYGNPASNHDIGFIANAAVIKARRQVATVLGSRPREIVFTAGATESNNMTVLGTVLQQLHNRKLEPVHLITSCVEHKCILEAFARAAEWGAELTILPVNEFGTVSLEQVEAALKPHTRLVSLIFANNEVGSLNPIAEVGALCRQRGIYLHTDAAQAFGKVAIDVNEMNIDLLSISAHKIYGPKGAGALFIREGVAIKPLIVGGKQESGLRAGTLNVNGIVGLGEASALAQAEMDADSKRCIELREGLLQRLRKAVPELILNGHPQQRLSGNLSITLPGLTMKIFEKELENLAVSSTSACNSGNPQPSHVLMALGRNEGQCFSTVRLGLGRFTTADEVEKAGDILIAMALKERK